MLANSRHHRFGLRSGTARKQQGELVTADAEPTINPHANRIADSCSQLLQHQIATLMPVTIIDLLEVVDVDVDQTQGLT